MIENDDLLEKKVLWKGNDQVYHDKKHKDHIILTIVAIPILLLFMFIFILEGKSFGEIIVIIIVISYLLLVSLFETPEKKTAYYLLTRTDLQIKYIDHEEIIKINKIDRYTLRHKSYGGKVRLYMKSNTTSKSIMTNYIDTLEPILKELILNR